MVELLFLAVPRGFLQFVIVVFPDHTHLLCLTQQEVSNRHLTDRESYKKCYNEYASTMFDMFDETFVDPLLTNSPSTRFIHFATGIQVSRGS